jgi:hypothetical protein
MQTAMSISDAELRAADAIHTIDPHDPNAAGHQLWGNRSAQSQIQPDPGRTIVEIALPSDDHVSLLALIDRIERAKGELPPDVRVLRRNLAG